MCSKQENSETKTDIITEVTSELPSGTFPEIDSETNNESIDEVVEEDISETCENDSKEKGVHSLDQCQNCGTKLNGKYCHNCGQHITDHAMTVRRFILDYIDNTFLWDPQTFKTIRLLVCRPGFLTKEYIAGKFVSQVQPLKLNMFLLLLFVTLFVFFASSEKINNSILNMTSNDMMLPYIQMDEISNNQEYLEKINASPCDTVKLCAPLFLSEEFPHLISAHKVIYDTEGEDLDLWIAIVPHILIEDEYIIPSDDDCYSFNKEKGSIPNEIAISLAVWELFFELFLQYFPMMILLTAPFLAYSLRLVQRNKKRPYFDHFIFSMHYIAYVELSIIVLYLLYLIVQPSMSLLNYLFTISSCIYFAISFHVVYGTSWFRSITKAILSNVIYYIICLSAIFVVFIIACIIVAENIDIDI